MVLVLVDCFKSVLLQFNAGGNIRRHIMIQIN